MPPELPPSTRVKWNEVTWYSKLGAIVLFAGVVPALSFYLGLQYERTRDILSQIAVQTPYISHPMITTFIPTSPIKRITITKTMGMVPSLTSFEIFEDFLTKTFTSLDHTEKDSVPIDAQYYKTLEEILARHNLSSMKSDLIPPDAPHTGLHVEVGSKTYDWYCLDKDSECARLVDELLSSSVSLFALKPPPGN
jgi:hypothetical protein